MATMGSFEVMSDKSGVDRICT